MGNGSGVSRGDRNRNARLGRLRVLVPVANAIAGIGLADKKQMVVVTDHDPRVIARRTFRCRAWDLAAGLDCLKRRLSHIVCRPMLDDLVAAGTSPPGRVREDTGEASLIQRGRLTSPHQLFGQVTSRTRHNQA